MSAEQIDETQEKLICQEIPRLLSVADALRSARECGDYYFEMEDSSKNPIFFGLENKDEMMANHHNKCCLKLYKKVDGLFVGVDASEVTISSSDERFKAVIVVKRCPSDNDAIIGTSRYTARNRTITGQGVVENIKLAYLF